MPFLAFLKGSNLILLAVVAIVSASTATWATLKIKNGEIAAIHLAHEKAVNAAIVKAQAMQRAADAVTLDIAVAHAEAQEKIVVKNRTIIKEVTKYVSDTSTCITYGLVRVLDAGALGADPAGLVLPAGVTDETCAPVKASALAEHVVANYGLAQQNAQQLTDLQDWVKRVLPNHGGGT